MHRLLPVVILLAIIGAAVSAYGLWQHNAPLGTAICNINDAFSCDIVNKSPWSEVFGIPVAFIGLVGYLVLLGFAYAAGKSGSRSLLMWLLVLSLVGLAIQAHLTYIEFFVIGVACPICLVSQGSILAIAVLIALAVHRGTSSPGRDRS